MNRRKVGSIYEDKACSYMTGIGMKILERNFRIREGEIDIVARDGLTIVFTEVKFRKNAKAGSALDAIGLRKRLQIIRVARVYLFFHHIPENVPVRFDCIGIDDDKITYIRDAFDITGSVG